MYLYREKFCSGIIIRMTQLVLALTEVDRRLLCNMLHHYVLQALFAIRRVLLAQHTAFPVSGADLYEELLNSTAILSTGNPRYRHTAQPRVFWGLVTWAHQWGSILQWSYTLILMMMLLPNTSHYSPCFFDESSNRRKTFLWCYYAVFSALQTGSDCPRSHGIMWNQYY